MESLTNLKELIALFPPRDAQRDSYSVFGSKFIYTVVEDLDGDILTQSGIERTARLHNNILNLATSSGTKLSQICLKQTSDSECTFHPLAYALQDDIPYLAVQFMLRYPVIKLGDLSIDNALVFGRVQIQNNSLDVDGNAPIEKAAAIRIFYLIENSQRAEEWIDFFLSVIPKYKENNTRILWSSSKSLANEMERNGELLIPWMPWTALLLVIFCMVVCSSKDPVRSQPFIGFFAMFSATMSTVASTALLLYLRYPFLPLVFIMPFLVISIGTDNMFLMLNSWRMAHGKDLEKRFTAALTETSASLFLTSLTDGLSFSIGSISEFYAVPLPLGLDLQLLTPDGSYVAEELEQQERLFGNYGPYCFAVVKLHNFTLANPKTRIQLLELYEALGSHSLVSKAEFWLEDFEQFINKDREKEESENFNDVLFTFLANPQNQRYRTDIRFALDGRIEAIKMLLRVRHLKPEHDDPRAFHLRTTMKNSQFDGFVYDTSFLLVDQQTITVYNVVVNVISAIITMAAICCLMVPRLLSTFCIAVSILSINIGVVGALSFMSTRLDIISMITIVMSVGFSVDYVTHTTFHYVVQKDDRLQRCLLFTFSPILQSALSTAVGVLPLIFVPSYIVPKSEYLEAYGADESSEDQFAISPNTIYYVGHAITYDFQMTIDKPPVKPDKKRVAPTIPVKPKEQQTGEKKGILRSLSFQFSNLGRKKSNDYDFTPEEPNYDDMGPMLGVQCFGTLLKKYKKKNRPAKWSKRFFVLKECFLIYYTTKFKKTFEKTRRIDLHPKGIIPLIGCSIVSGGDVGKKHCLLIAHPQFASAIIVAAPDFKVQEQWLKALRNATKVSYKNTLVGETMIRELESKGLLLNEEKKTYEEKLEAEAKARQEEKERAAELIRLKEELEEEREKLIRTTKKLKDDLQNVKSELKLTNEMKKTLEQEKISLNSKTEYLQANMESLNIEKEKVQEQMQGIIREREQFLLENQNLSTTTCQLKNRLLEIETKTNCIQTEKEKIETLLRLNEHKTADLEKERQYYTKQTQDLMSNLKEVSEQKELTETELREQMMARIGAEKQLQAAEKALEHLEMALKMTGAQMTELQEHIMPDVHKLREFFEQCAEEAKWEANRTGIMRQAIYARKSLFDAPFFHIDEMAFGEYERYCRSTKA
ncbi:hypothetical protein WR25_16469 [Diploscapter pachys]|uniref:PH domain-containing protein n=1 Tax=Diploscapter pachys TaxID=2018661 RepID=A0A2A2LI45_9BILA|nr:hypothetical protein WR25_16469 [Diploscapter pachys]